MTVATIKVGIYTVAVAHIVGVYMAEATRISDTTEHWSVVVACVGPWEARADDLTEAEAVLLVEMVDAAIAGEAQP